MRDRIFTHDHHRSLTILESVSTFAVGYPCTRDHAGIRRKVCAKIISLEGNSARVFCNAGLTS